MGDDLVERIKNHANASGQMADAQTASVEAIAAAESALGFAYRGCSHHVTARSATEASAPVMESSELRAGMSRITEILFPHISYLPAVRTERGICGRLAYFHFADGDVQSCLACHATRRCRFAHARKGKFGHSVTRSTISLKCG